MYIIFSLGFSSYRYSAEYVCLEYIVCYLHSYTSRPVIICENGIIECDHMRWCRTMTTPTQVKIGKNSIIECDHMCWCQTLTHIGHGHAFNKKCLCCRVILYCSFQVLFVLL